jgi:hypothetical protein
VDLDPFAVNIARLRLWLSLVVDFEDGTPPPLPNLDFKIEVGDSLTAPDPSGGLRTGFRKELVERFFRLKANYLMTHGGEKLTLREQIEALRAEIAAWAGRPADMMGFDWAVEFAEVFFPSPEGRERGPGGEGGGFDIVLTNPPYVRMELFKDAKPTLRRNYPHVHAERADLYVYFYARAHQLLRPDGVSCFISSNKWLRAGYGEKLRQHLLDAQAFRLVVDFGELPVFQAATFPAIFLWQKQPRADMPTMWAVVKDLQVCYNEGIREHVTCIARTIPASQFGKGKPRLIPPAAVARRAKMEASGPCLGELPEGQAMMGIKTGLNEAFVIDRATHDRLVSEDQQNAEVIKPLLAGDDVRRYEIYFRETYLLYMIHGIDIRRYPAIREFLKPFRDKLERRATRQEWYELQQPQAAYIPFFDKPKIIYAQIMMEPRFYLDSDGYYTNQKCYFIPSADWYLLGILNSAPVWDHLKTVSVTFGDPDKRGRLEPRVEHILSLPIPDAQVAERETVAKLAQQAQQLHAKRRERAEQFLRDIGTPPARSSSRNPLERPWTLTPDKFARRARRAPLRLFTDVRDETAELTEQIARVEHEIDERVAGLYGV